MIGFILVEVKTGEIPSVIKKLRSKIPSLEEIHAITGPYDIIIKVSTKDLINFKEVLEFVHQTEGISKTLSCIALP